jgi:hypothetical protein
VQPFRSSTWATRTVVAVLAPLAALAVATPAAASGWHHEGRYLIPEACQKWGKYWTVETGRFASYRCTRVSTGNPTYPLQYDLYLQDKASRG